MNKNSNMALETTVLLDGLEFPEGPRWRDGKLWFSDMDDDRVLTVDMEGHAETVVNVPGGPSGLGWLPNGKLQIVSVSRRRLLRLDSDGLSEVADLSELASGRTNDMVVDHLGRAYIGNFGFEFLDPTAIPTLANIILVTPEGKARAVADDMAFPNGMVITPDGRTLIVAESLAARLTAFDIAADGSLSRRRVWAQFDGRGFGAFDTSRAFPDGICLDAENAIWVASAEGSREVLRVIEGGEITHRVKVATQPFAAMLGGPDRLTLFVCTSFLRDGALGSGRIETVKVEVPGAGLP
jgi:sugar lactone lactonase YvrE